MASIKDVAKLAGVSVSTVSIIINGKAEERNLSKRTQKKVWASVKQLKYQPNLSARNLRMTTEKKTVALFWTTDFREVMASRFLAGLNAFINRENLNIEIVVHTYKSGSLSEENSFNRMADFHGAIIATATEADIAFLESNRQLFPVVLYNRFSEKFSAVMIDDSQVGHDAAKVFASLKHKSLALVCTPYVFDGMRVRDSAFLDVCQKAGIHVSRYESSASSAEAGYEICKAIDFSEITGIYLPNDTFAIGVRRYCYEHGIDIPNDISILSIGNGIPIYSQFSVPSMSVIDIPMEAMAERSLQIMDDYFNAEIEQPSEIHHEYFNAPVVLRESIAAGNKS